MVGQIIGELTLSKNPRHTTNHFEPLSAIAGKTLKVLERNERGDCLCIVEDSYLVDVDHRDIEALDLKK